MNEHIARERLNTALRDYKQEFGSFFIAKMLGLKISYSEKSCDIQIPVDDFLFNPQGTYHGGMLATCLLYTSPSPRDRTRSRMPSSA